MRPTLHVVGRIRLSDRQRSVWRILADAAPAKVTTVDELLHWVRERKAQLVADDPECDPILRSQLLDALFEWSTGVEMPDALPEAAPTEKPPKTAGALSRNEGGRVALERELVMLVIADKGESDRARELSESLRRRGALEAVRADETTGIRRTRISNVDRE